MDFLITNILIYIFIFTNLIKNVIKVPLSGKSSKILHPNLLYFIFDTQIPFYSIRYFNSILFYSFPLLAIVPILTHHRRPWASLSDIETIRWVWGLSCKYQHYNPDMTHEALCKTSRSRSALISTAAVPNQGVRERPSGGTREKIV